MRSPFAGRGRGGYDHSSGSLPPVLVPPSLPLAAFLLAWAQAGGGGAFGGGGGGGGGGDDGIGIALELVYWCIRLAIEVPALGIPLLIALLVVLGIGLQRGWWRHQERVIRRRRPERDAQSSRAAAALLRAVDAAFDERRFLARVERAFRRTQDAWCAQDLEPVRAFLSDGVLERFSLQIEEQRADGWRQGMKLERVGPLGIEHAQAGRHFETVTVRIPFQADIHRLELANDERIAGSDLPRARFRECWSFVRRRGAKTLAGEGLIEGKCPNCGAPLAMNRTARCGHCQAHVRSGQFDWVLAEITQSSEWSAADEGAIPGLAPFLARDPGMNAQVLEDRASVAFWRLAAAERRASTEPLARVADEELCRRTEERYSRRAGVRRSFDAERAVGSVRTLGILAGAERDRAVVQIVWDGRHAVIEPGAKTRIDARRALRRSLFVFTRPAGVATRLDEAFTTAHCRTCGAHDTGGTASACPYCGTARTGGREEWMLTEVVEAGELAGAKLRNELQQIEVDGSPLPRPIRARAARELVQWSLRLAQSDGTVNARERRALHALAARADIPLQRVEELLFTPDQPDVLVRPADEAEARVWFDELIALAMADGALSHGEHRLLRQAAEGFGLPRQELARDLARARVELYRESRQARRAARTSQ